MRGAPPSPSWYGAHAACATRDGGLVYASDKAVCVLDGETGAVRGLVGTKARALAVCAATTSETREGEDDEGGGAREVVVCGCADKVLRTLDARAMAFVGKTMTGGHKHEVTATCARGAGEVASGCRDGTVAVWRVLGNGSPTCAYKAIDGPITCMAAVGDVIAVGGANGTVCALNARSGATHRVAASGYGEITSLAWTTGGVREGETKDLLAVGSRERRVTIWALEGDKLVNTHELRLPKPKAALSEAQRGRVWVAVAWSPRSSRDDNGDNGCVELVTSGQGGDLLSWRVPLKFGDGVEEVTEAKTFGPRDVAHTRTVFTIDIADDTCWSTSLDRKVACWDLETVEQRWSFTALGGYVYDLATDAEDPFAVAIACGDGTVHGWDLSPTLSSGLGESLLWKGIPNTKVTAIARKPRSEVVAFGLDDGRVGCFDVTTGKFACYPECHGASVRALQWFEICNVGEESGTFTLTSLGADGSLWRWMETFDPASCDTKKSGIVDARKFGKYLDLARLCGGETAKDTRSIEAFDYSSVFGRFAIGWSDGELSAHDFGEEKWRRREHSKSVSRVKWHPECDDDASDFTAWLATSSTSGSVIIHGVGGDVICALPRAAVYDIAWSQQKSVALLACALHGAIKVWRIDKTVNEFHPVNIAVLRGHFGKVMCVQFATHDDETIISGGDDKTFRVWRYKDDEHAPRENETPANKDSAAVVDENAACESPTKSSKTQKPCVVKTKKVRSSGLSGALLKPSHEESTPTGIRASQEAVVALARRAYKGANDPLSANELKYGPSGLGLYEDADAAMALLMNEARLASDENPSTHEIERAVALHMYRGDYAHAAATVLQASEAPISHELMSLFVGGGYDVWSIVAAAQRERLEIAGEHQLAAMVSLSLHDVRGAIQTLRRGGLVRDAAALAAARLLPTDELLLDTRRELAAVEETRGGMESAAKAHISIRAPAAAVRALIRADAGGALAAANLALECGLTGPQERRTIVRAALELAETDDFDRAVAMLADLAAILRRRDSDVAVTDAITAATAPDSRVAVELTRRLRALELDA